MDHMDSQPGKGLVWVTLRPQLENKLSPAIFPYFLSMKNFTEKKIKFCKHVSPFWCLKFFMDPPLSLWHYVTNEAVKQDLTPCTPAAMTVPASGLSALPQPPTPLL